MEDKETCSCFQSSEQQRRGWAGSNRPGGGREIAGLPLNARKGRRHDIHRTLNSATGRPSVQTATRLVTTETGGAGHELGDLGAGAWWKKPRQLLCCGANTETVFLRFTVIASHLEGRLRDLIIRPSAQAAPWPAAGRQLQVFAQSHCLPQAVKKSVSQQPHVIGRCLPHCDREENASIPSNFAKRISPCISFAARSHSFLTGVGRPGTDSSGIVDQNTAIRQERK